MLGYLLCMKDVKIYHTHTNRNSFPLSLNMIYCICLLLAPDHEFAMLCVLCVWVCVCNRAEINFLPYAFSSSTRQTRGDNDEETQNFSYPMNLIKF